MQWSTALPRQGVERLRRFLDAVTRADALRPLRMWYARKVVLPAVQERYEKLSSGDAFSAIYAQRVWGTRNDETFYSGPGSRDPFISRYCDIVSSFIIERGVRSVVDLGCGDFAVGRRIAAPGIRYVGIDVVEALIEHNTALYGTDSISFRKCDITTDDDLPGGDLCLVRQVLQHLSNEEILKVLDTCAKYPFLIITEHISSNPQCTPNVDMVHGPQDRVYLGSGVFVDKPPFSKRATMLLEVEIDKHSLLRTSLVEQRESRR
jgi:SAM-dependent methyltransferase